MLAPPRQTQMQVPFLTTVTIQKEVLVAPPPAAAPAWTSVLSLTHNSFLPVELTDQHLSTCCRHHNIALISGVRLAF